MRDQTHDAMVIDEFRANGGRVGGSLAGTSILLLHHIGAKSGIRRVVPLAFTRHGAELVVVASNGGSARDPGWSVNLRAHPEVDIEVGGERIRVLARLLTGAARAELWPSIVAAAPAVGEFQSAAARLFPVFLLEPRER